MKNKDFAKTKTSGIIGVIHSGGLLSRFVPEGGVLIGQTVMVPASCRCLLVAGDAVAAQFEAGPHLLSLEHFNRQPAGLLYTVPVEPETVSWFPPDTAYRRTMVLAVENPARFVQQVVLGHNLEETEGVVRLIAQQVDALIPPGQLATADQAAHTGVVGFLLQLGISTVHFEEAQATAPPPPPAKG